MWKAEKGLKTRHGDDSHQRASNPTAQATNNECCPVRLFKKFSTHRPEKMKHPDLPFFLAINHKRKTESQIWYCNSPLGKNTIGKFLVNAAKAAGLPGKIRNHSIRKTCISWLMVADLPQNYVVQLSGHKNLKSLDAYKSASQCHQRRMSMVLSRSTGNSGIPAAKMSEVLVQRQEASTSRTEGFFSGATIGKFEGCTFNFNMPTAALCSEDGKTTWPPKRKKRVAIISDDSDSD